MNQKKNKLKEIREKRNLSQEQLSEKSGISRVTISKLECGQQKEVKVGTLLSLAQALNEKVESIFF